MMNPFYAEDDTDYQHRGPSSRYAKLTAEGSLLSRSRPFELRIMYDVAFDRLKYNAYVIELKDEVRCKSDAWARS